MIFFSIPFSCDLIYNLQSHIMKLQEKIDLRQKIFFVDSGMICTTFLNSVFIIPRTMATLKPNLNIVACIQVSLHRLQFSITIKRYRRIRTSFLWYRVHVWKTMSVKRGYTY